MYSSINIVWICDVLAGKRYYLTCTSPRFSAGISSSLQSVIGCESFPSPCPLLWRDCLSHLDRFWDRKVAWRSAVRSNVWCAHALRSKARTLLYVCERAVWNCLFAKVLRWICGVTDDCTEHRLRTLVKVLAEDFVLNINDSPRWATVMARYLISDNSAKMCGCSYGDPLWKFYTCDATKAAAANSLFRRRLQIHTRIRQTTGSVLAVTWWRDLAMTRLGASSGFAKTGSVFCETDTS